MHNNTLNINVDYGGLLINLNENMGIYLPYVIVYSISVVTGVFGNSLTCLAVLTNRELRMNSTFILVANLAFTDVVISLVVNSFTVIGVLFGKRFFDHLTGLCNFVGSVCLTTCTNALLTMTLLAFNRYCLAYHYAMFVRVFTIKRTLLYCALMWLSMLSLNIPNLIGQGGIVYDLELLTCVLNRFNKTIVIVAIVAYIFVPCTMIVYFYASLFWGSFRISADSLKLAKCLFATFFLFVICWVPVGIVFINDIDNRFHSAAHIYISMVAHVNSVLNPIFYCMFNLKMRASFKKILAKLAPSVS